MLYNKINILIGIGFPASLVYLYFKFCKSKKDKIEGKINKYLSKIGLKKFNKCLFKITTFLIFQ